MLNFFRYAAVAVVLAFSVSCAPPQQATEVPNHVQIEYQLETVGAIVDDFGMSFCSGVFIEEGFLTAAHCVDEGTEFNIGVWSEYDEVKMSFDETFPFRLAKFDEVRDVALLVGVTNNHKRFHRVAKVSDRFVRRGDAVMAFGHPWNMHYMFSRGEVVTPFRFDGWGMPFTLVNLFAAPGSSGGPVFNNNGEIVGLVSFGWHRERHMVGTVALGSIIYMLND